MESVMSSFIPSKCWCLMRLTRFTSSMRVVVMAKCDAETIRCSLSVVSVFHDVELWPTKEVLECSWEEMSINISVQDKVDRSYRNTWRTGEVLWPLLDARTDWNLLNVCVRILQDCTVMTLKRLTMQAIGLTSLTSLNKQAVLFSHPRQLEPSPLTTKTQDPLFFFIKDCVYP